jgi:anti-anti-sigma factor
MSKPLMLDIREDRGVLIIAPVGRIDSETYTDLENDLNDAISRSPKKVMLDMEKCNYVSSAGIRVFFDFRKKLKAQKAAVSFFKLQPQIRKVFEIVKALPLECIFSSMKEADAYLDRVMAEELKKPSSE